MATTVNLSRGSSFFQRRYPIKLIPLNHLSIKSADGKATRWLMSGNDPQFDLVVENFRSLPAGYYLLTLRCPGGIEQMKLPRVYIDSGKGLSENETQALHFSDSVRNWYVAQIKLPAGAKKIRFDPSVEPGEFALSNARLIRITQAEYYWPTARFIIRRELSKRGGIRKAAGVVLRTLRESGLEGVKAKARSALLNQAPVAHQNDVLKRSRYEEWVDLNESSAAKRADLQRRLSEWAENDLPTISVVCPIYNTPPRLLREAVESVLKQVYQKWELVLVDDCSTNDKTRRELSHLGEKNEKIRVIRQEKNGGISKSTNTGVEASRGSVIALLDHDDLLTEDALGEVALCYANNSEVDVVYSDDDKIDMDGRRYDPQFKPGWSPTLLLNYMYISHLMTMKKDLYQRVGGCRSAFDGTQDHDLALRATEHARLVRHVPKVLYHWRAAPGSLAQSSGAKPLAAERGRVCVAEAFARRGLDVHVEQPAWARPAGLGIYAPIFGDTGPSVTILIPSRNNVECLQRCIESLEKTTYENYSVLILDNESKEKKTVDYLAKISGKDHVRVERIKSPKSGFSFSNINNIGASCASGELLLFLNDDTEITDPRWLSQMVGYLRMDGVGAVGARLHYEDGHVQHGGVVHGLHNGLAGHAFRHASSDSTGYLWYLRVAREYSAVTAACLLTRAETFHRLGGFDEEDFAVAYNDVDFCLRVLKSGLRNVYCGQVGLNHYEGRSRPRTDNPSEIVAYRRRYGAFQDPYYNPNLSLEDESFAIRPRGATLASNAIRTLMVSHDLELEGAPKCMFDLVAALVHRGTIKPHIVSPKDGPLRAEYEQLGVEVTILPISFAHAGEQSLNSFDNALKPLRTLIKKTEAEVVYANTLVTFWAIASAHRENIPSIWNPRESFPPETYFNHLPIAVRDEAYRCFDYAYKVVFVSNASRHVWRNYDSRYSFDVIKDSLKAEDAKEWRRRWKYKESRKKLGIESDELCFLALGTVWDHKGQLDLVKAIAEMDEDKIQNVQFLIVGDRPGPYSKEIQDFMSERFSEKKRIRTKILPATSEPYQFLAAADVGLCCSRVDTFPRVILEYMAFGLPIITTPVYGISEQIQPDVNALTYAPDDIPTLKKHLEKMIVDRQERTRLAKNSELVLQCLPSFEQMVARYGAIFSEARFATIARRLPLEKRKA